MRVAKESESRRSAVRSRTFQFSVLGLFLLVTACGLFFGFARLVGSFPLLMAGLSIVLTLATVLAVLGFAKFVQFLEHPKPWFKYVEFAMFSSPLLLLAVAMIELVLVAQHISDAVTILPSLVWAPLVTVLLLKGWKKRWTELEAKELAAAKTQK